MQICENCRWCIMAKGGDHGFCKIDPPTFTHVDDNDRPRFFNPVVGPTNFCSNWEAAKD